MDMSTVHTNELKTVDGTKSVQVEDIAEEAYVDGLAIGVGQTWQDMRASRELGIVYTNNTGRPIMVNVGTSNGTTAEALNHVANVNSVQVVNFRVNAEAGTHNYVSMSFIVPDMATYTVSLNSTTPEIIFWSELRGV